MDLLIFVSEKSTKLRGYNNYARHIDGLHNQPHLHIMFCTSALCLNWISGIFVHDILNFI